MSYSDVSGKYQNRKATKISEKTQINLDYERKNKLVCSLIE